MLPTLVETKSVFTTVYTRLAANSASHLPVGAKNCRHTHHVPGFTCFLRLLDLTLGQRAISPLSHLPSTSPSTSQSEEMTGGEREKNSHKSGKLTYLLRFFNRMRNAIIF